jgi:hypothetical protein
MRRRYRIALVAAFSVSAAVAILGLSALGDASEGPLSTALGWIGAAPARSSIVYAIGLPGRLGARPCVGWNRIAHQPTDCGSPTS